MDPILTLDIGAGTMDILHIDGESGVHYKAVVKSPVLSFPEQVARVKGNIFISGLEMGGGGLARILEQRAAHNKVVMTESAAATVHHDLDQVRSMGIDLVSDQDRDSFMNRDDFSHVRIEDIEIDRLKSIITGMGVPFSFHIIGICAQDHGVPPPGVSHLDYRHQMFQKRLDQDPRPETFLYRSDEIPESFNRLRSIAQSAGELPADEIYVMDSGMAAILGASLDPLLVKYKRPIILDMATSHTLAAVLYKEEIAAFFEYHTRDITLDRLEKLIIELAEGTIRHHQILNEGGHGAYTKTRIGYRNVDVLLATGPKRKLIETSSLPFVLGAPLGDNMMTGTLGLYEAIRRRKRYHLNNSGSLTR